MQSRIRVVLSIISFRQLGRLYYEEARNFAPPPYDGFAFVVVMCTIAQRAASGIFTGVRGIQILGSSYPRSCIAPPRYPWA
jgi:hypothetical protein